MNDFTNVVKDNFENLKSSIDEIKSNYPNIDNAPNSHDGSYELIQAIIMQYKEEIDNSTNWGSDDVNALYYSTTFVKRDTKIEKISKTNLKNKEKLKQLIQNLNKKFLNKEYTNNIDEANDIGMFKNISGGFGNKTNAKATEDDLKKFIIFCTEIINEKDNDVIYDKFEKNICNNVSDNNMSIGILSQILHCLKPNTFPILNSSGLEFYQKALNIKMQSEKGKEVQIDGMLKNYVKVINSIKDKTKYFGFNNYRILDIIAQKYYFNFDDINKYFTDFAGTSSKNRPANEVGKCKAGHENFKLISKKINKNNFKCEIHQWNNGKTANSYFWAEYKNEKFKDLPYSISFFAEEKNMQFRVDVECKGKDSIFSKWIPDKIIGFDDFGNNTSKLVKTFNGPFEYANSRNTIKQIQDAFSKLEPEYNKLCNIALGKVLPATESAGESGEDKTMRNFPLNQILYGPPGTGKTYKISKFIEDYIYPQIKEDNSKYDDILLNYDLSWVERIIFAFKINNPQNKPLTDTQITNLPLIQRWFLISSRYRDENSLKCSIRGEMQKNAIRNDGEYSRHEKDYFKKTDKGFILTKDGENIFNEISEYNNFNLVSNKTFDKSILAKNYYTFCTFHQSYSYEDFVEGIRPVIKKDNANSMQFDYHCGIFKDICIKAKKEPDKKFFIFIDEINRGNISKIFGELITLIEKDKREKVFDDGDEYYTVGVKLPYTQDDFTVPNNLYIIGTMNTADKSLAQLDVALRRRFKFIPMYPEYEILDKNGNNIVQYSEFLKALNAKIFEKKKSADYLIGHSYFIGKKSQDLANVMNSEVIPLLMEYFNSNKDLVKNLIEDLLKNENYSINENNKYLLEVIKNQ